MRIAITTARSGAGFKLDTGAIGTRSLSVRDIKLPYMGELPEQLRPVKSAYIYVDAQLIQGVRLTLVVNDEKGKRINRPLDASSEEIIMLLDRFFAQRGSDTGLTEYWRGACQAHYIEWKKFVTGPDRLLDAIFTLSDQDRRFLQKHMMDRAAAV